MLFIARPRIANGRDRGKVRRSEMGVLLCSESLRASPGVRYFRGAHHVFTAKRLHESEGGGGPAPRPDRPPGGYTILVVDDEEAVRRLASRMITWMGNQALEARHAREALATIEEHNGPIHLVLTDMKMPGMNGRELGRIIEQRWPGKPILYMSGFASEVFRDGLLEPGAPFLAKPFTQDDLASRVRGDAGAGALVRPRPCRLVVTPITASACEIG